MIKIVNIKTGTIVAAYRQNVITEFNREKYNGLPEESINSAEKRHGNLMATFDEVNRQMEVQARNALRDLNGFFGALPGNVQEPHGYVMVLTGSHDVYGEVTIEG